MGLGDFFKRKTKVKQATALTPEQEGLLRQVTALSSQAAPEVQRTLLQFMRGDTGFGDQQIEQFYKEGVEQPALQNWQTQVKPNLEEQFGQMYHSSARTKALSRSFADMMNSLSQTRANLLYQGRLTNLAARQQALGALQQGVYQPLGVRAFENIVTQQASPFDMAVAGLGAAAQVYGSIKGSGTGSTSERRSV